MLNLLGRLSLGTVRQVAWSEVKSFFQSTHVGDAAFNVRCAAEASRELNEGSVHVKTIAAEAKRLLDVPSWATSQDMQCW